MHPDKTVQRLPVKIFSPAKINLFLQVVGRRTDGYHDLFTLMCLIGLGDTVGLTFETEEIRVSCSDPDVPADQSNLACRAAACFFKHFNKARKQIPAGVAIDIDKRIPVGSGLGGGSNNAAAVLSGLNQHYGNPFSTGQIRSMGVTIGADVPFFLYGKTALARGVGDKLEAYTRLKPYHVVLVFPGFSVSTREVFESLNLGLTNCEKKINDDSFIKQGFDAGRHLCNDLETVTASHYPDIQEAKEALLSHGAEGALMSGSGPTIFGLFNSARDASAAGAALERDRLWRTVVTALQP